jgi:hypothetical protein
MLTRPCPHSAAEVGSCTEGAKTQRRKDAPQANIAECGNAYVAAHLNATRRVRYVSGKQVAEMDAEVDQDSEGRRAGWTN